ncbi:hypothetical protein PINS_up005190 [Pythium insidiosum]|nr:hypothetical protein PINS_up005190 [Pythium insidiosum]
MSSSKNVPWEDLEYLPGFGGHFCSEALPDALPKAQNNPQKCPYGLYAEQLSGTAFTLPRHKNQRSWLYRVLPAVVHEKYQPVEQPFLESDFATHGKLTPQQMRWRPMPMPSDGERVDFIQGLRTIGGAGDPTVKSGLAIHMYTANASMTDKCFYNSDGDWLIVPQEGVLKITTEFGKLRVAPREICVIQRGIRFSVDLDGPSRGYICEVFNRHFILPDLGPIGSNGLANPRDFEHPVAWYEDSDREFLCVNKFGGRLFSARMAFSPFNVVAWHGNYVPYKYDLMKFCTMNSVSYDHPDPSIYCVLTCQTEEAGNAVCDFVIFPPRWMVMEHSFRPPWFHRNCMTEYMGMIYGVYDAKKGGKDGFVPGGASLHSCDTPHGPDADTFLKASNAELKPEKFDGGLAFMFESTYLVKLTDYALQCEHNDQDYYKCWQKMPKLFDPTSVTPK